MTLEAASNTPDNANARLETWVKDVLDGPVLVGGCFLPVGATVFLLLILDAGDWYRAHPDFGAPLLWLAVATATAFALLTAVLIGGGAGLRKRREWGRALLLDTVGPALLTWGVLAAWVLGEAAFFCWHGCDPRLGAFRSVVIDRLLFSGVAMLVLLRYLLTLRRALRGRLATAACAGPGPWEEAVRARVEWGAQILAGSSGLPTAEGEYPGERESRRRAWRGAIRYLPLLLWLAYLWRDAAQDWSFLLFVGILLVVAWCRQITRVRWEAGGVTIHRRVGRPRPIPWAEIKRVEVVLPPMLGGRSRCGLLRRRGSRRWGRFWTGRGRAFSAALGQRAPMEEAEK